MSDRVEGWLDDRAANATRWLLSYQHSRDMIGDIMEIGVYAGKYFLVLIEGLAHRERAVAIDIFESQEPVLRDSVQGRREVFESNIKIYAPHNAGKVVILERDSTTLSADDIRQAIGDARSVTLSGKPMRFISIDGSHDLPSVFLDLVLAEALLMPGGVIALDDWAPDGNKQWPGVAAAEIQYQVTFPDTLLHIGAIPNKLLLTNDGMWAADYRRVLRDLARDMERTMT